MNHDEILALSGPQLSEAVARHVMGWKPVVLGCNFEEAGSVWDAGGKWKLIPRVPFRQKDGGLFAIVAEVWEPHADLGSAWGIMERIDRRTFEEIIREIRCWRVSPSVAEFLCRAVLVAKFAT